MAKKQLDFNAPLLSVRKIPSSLASSERANKKIVDKIPPNRLQSLPVKKSDWELSAVTKPAAVPFVWEQIPGRPKDDNEVRTNLRVERASSPRLPPGRLPETVRFYSGERPRTHNIYRSPAEGLPWMDHAALLDSLVESMYSRGDRENEDDAYSDALETMSPTESLSLNCSVSGLSGHQSSDLQPSGTFSIDSQTRDFMMSRFLPAAKAAVLETPQYVHKKPVSAEQPMPVKKLVPVERKPVVKPLESYPVSPYSSYPADVGSETEDDVSENPHKKPSKGWKFFPRICVKNSLCLLNPLPGLKVKTRAPTPSAQSVKRVPGMKPKMAQSPTSYAHEVKKLSRKAYSGPIEKNACDNINKQRFHSGVLSRELYKPDNRSLSGQLSNPSDSCKLVGISPGRRSRSGAISPYRNVAPPSPFNEGTRFLGVPKEMESLWASRFDSFRKGCYTVKDKAPQRMVTGRFFDSPSEIVEKTLYVDSVDNVPLSAPNAASSKPKGLVNSLDKNMRTPLENSKVSEKLAAVAPTKGAKQLDVSEKDGKQIAEKKSFLDLMEASPMSISRHKGPADQESLKPKQNLDTVPGALESSKVHPCGNLGTENEDNPDLNDPKDSNLTSLESTLPPPLPKSPSESWLWRTLPSIPLKTPFLSFNSKKQHQKPHTDDTKWETIVKTSNLHKDHVRYSEELYTLDSCQQSKP
ncbi:putative oryzain alpha chain-like [Capsicum annuum]|nr:putative oryzain alpha chain-like [Capsicum annuum]KAF3629838.1 putative oryzain alpha chain-like [Capsicum annuum]